MRFTIAHAGVVLLELRILEPEDEYAEAEAPSILVSDTTVLADDGWPEARAGFLP